MARLNDTQINGSLTVAKDTHITGSITTNSLAVDGECMIGGTCSVTGDMTVSKITASSSISANLFNATSDARLKMNLKEYLPAQSILDLPIYTFDFIDGPKNQIGCLAQDLEKICPELVSCREDGYLNIQETKIVYLLLAEIKNLRERLNSLEGK